MFTNNNSEIANQFIHKGDQIINNLVSYCRGYKIIKVIDHSDFMLMMEVFDLQVVTVIELTGDGLYQEQGEIHTYLKDFFNGEFREMDPVHLFNKDGRIDVIYDMHSFPEFYVREVLTFLFQDISILINKYHV